MDDHTFETLRILMELPGPTGQETAVMEWLATRWRPRARRIWSTKVGNLLAHVGGAGPKLLIQAHADEIGFVVRSIDEKGFLWLSNAQIGVNFGKRFPVGQPALVLGNEGPMEGLFASTSGHILTEEQRQQDRVDIGNVFVDVGASTRQDVLDAGIYPGAGVIWNPPVRRLGTRIYGKAIDDRVSLAIMTRLLDDADPSTFAWDVYFAATVQEEIGLVGAKSLRADLDVDAALALDNGLVGDIPTVGERHMPTVLGGGPTLVHKDNYVHYDKRLIWRLNEIAVRHGIPVQHAVYENFGSDGAALIQQGIPAALIAPATRYTHSAFEMIDQHDVMKTLELVSRFVSAPIDGWPEVG